MLEKPYLDETALVSQLERDYEIVIVWLEFLPLGADRDTAVYRTVIADGTIYFVKLRRNSFDEASATLPHFFGEHGLKHIITPLLTKSGQLWSTLEAFTIVLYPFVAGEDGYSVALTEENWRDFGKTLKHLHTLDIPATLSEGLRRETYALDTRKAVRGLLTRLESMTFNDEAGREMARFMMDKQREILELVVRAEQYAQTLGRRNLDFVLCHDDLHAGNLLIRHDHHFYIVDWDSPILAPKERDLMFIGGGLGFRGYTPQQEETLFYQGYGQTDIDLLALSYYRIERILRDIDAYGDELVNGIGSQEERELSFHYLKSNFEPGSTIERAYAATERSS